MQIKPFKLERYFAAHEFSAPFLLSASDCESLSLQELLDWADPEGLELWHQLGLGYTETQGHPLLRQEISQLYGQVAPDDVLVVAPEEGIFIAMNTLLAQGDHAVVVSPAYQSLYEIARALGCGITDWAVRATQEGWRLDLGRLERSIQAETRLLVINFPHNPTGHQPSRRDLEAIVELAREHDLYVFSDEMYRLLEFDPAHRLPPVCDLYEKGISLSGLSKTFSLPGLRIGWLATRDKALMDEFFVIKDYTTICSSAPSEVLGIIALRAREAIVHRNLEIVRHNLESADRFFADNGDWFAWLRPQAGSVAFPRLRAGITVERFCQDVLERQGVMIVPGSIFDFPGDHFRLGLGRKNLAQALERVQEYIDVMRGA
jgi:aspartate/methionine/tyrosine aminotransferase